jgi:uncharacterized membrane protein YkvA (DUF1232 family)
MKSFFELLEEDIQDYNGRHENLINHAPALYGLMKNMLDDPDLPGRLRPAVLAALGYFVIPDDIIPEELQGPTGYIDDIYVCCLVGEYVRRELKSDEILTRNWKGVSPILMLIGEVLGREKDLLGEKRSLVLDYLGIEALRKLS